MPKRKLFVFYHFNCTDGIGAAWCANRWASLNNFEIKLIGCNPNQNEFKDFDFSELDRFSEVCIFDTLPGLDFLEKLDLHTAVRVEVQDHHKTNLDNLHKYQHLSNIDFHLDMNYSGAMLAWRYFFPGLIPPLIIKYIQDRDLFQNKLDSCNEIIACIYNEKISIETIQKYHDLLGYFEDQEFYNTVKRGSYILEAQRTQINQIKEKATIYECKEYDEYTSQAILLLGEIPDPINSYKIKIVNSANFQTDVGNELTNEPNIDFAIVWYSKWSKSEKCHMAHLSFRGNNKVDLTLFAKKFNPLAGGHANAAGCVMPLVKWFDFLQNWYENFDVYPIDEE